MSLLKKLLIDNTFLWNAKNWKRDWHLSCDVMMPFYIWQQKVTVYCLYTVQYILIDSDTCVHTFVFTYLHTCIKICQNLKYFPYIGKLS